MYLPFEKEVCAYKTKIRVLKGSYLNLEFSQPSSNLNLK